MIANSTDSTQSMDARRSGPTVHPVRVGPYRILGLLGEGGMGIVYHAEQTAPIHRHVALKLVKPGMDSGEVLARFASERQALALLNHPGIARVYEAGSTRLGRPYFVMEYVHGMPITDYCDRYRLANADRLGLFIQTCNAIQHAHSKGIIHRDVKPSNVLITEVDDRPVPKIIDFGVAKAVEQRLVPGTVYTGAGQLLGTPEYMSPEQAEMTGLDVDHRTDVYSLGVLLYELLVGALPFESSSLREAGQWEIQRIIREQEPLKPSTRLSSLGDQSTLVAERRRTDLRSLRRELRGDLDWIVMKALEKDRTRRYGSCSEFAADVQRHLNGEAVVARPPGFGYRASKFLVKRRRALMVSSAIFVLAALATVSTVLWRSAVAAARLSEALKIVAEARVDLHFDPAAALNQIEQALEKKPDLLEAKIEKAFALRRLNRDAEAIAYCNEIIGDYPQTCGPAHIVLAQLLRDDQPAEAERHRVLAEELIPDDLYYRAEVVPKNRPQEASTLLTAELDRNSHNFNARLARAWRRFDAGDFSGMLEDAEELTRRWPETAGFWNTKGIALTRLAKQAIPDQGLAAEKLSEAITAYGKFLDRKPDFARVLLNRADAYMNLAQLGSRSDWPETADLYLAGEDLDRAIEQEDKRAMAWALRARLHASRGAWTEAKRDIDQALVLDRDNKLAQVCRGEMLFFKDDSYAEALEWYEKGMAGEDNSPRDYNNRGILRRFAGRIADALEDHDEAVRLAPKVARVHVARATTRRFADDNVGAIADLRQAAQLDTETWGIVSHQWTWEMLTLGGDRQGAEAELAKSEQLAPDDLSKKVTALYRGTATPEEVLSAAQNEKLRRALRYYLGVRALVDSDPERAREQFEKCREGNGRTEEAELSRMHLERMARK